MAKKILAIVIPVVIIAAIIAAVILISVNNKLPENPDDTLGNTSGNLNNGGYFCEHDGKVYFANFNDSHTLYCMNPDGTDAVRLTDVPVSSINAAGDYLYFYYDDQGEAKFMGVSGNMRGIYRLPTNGKDDLTCLERATGAIACLIGNTVYYQHYDNTDGMTLYYVSTDGKKKGMALEEIVNPACVVYGNIYYPDQENMFYLNEYVPGSSYSSEYIKESMYNPTAVGDYIYYMKVDDNYCLYRYNITDATITKVTSERVDTFNVYGDVIFYQRNQDPALIRVNSDGSGAQVIAEGNYSCINCTSEYTYFVPFGEEVVYRTGTGSYTGVEEFNP